MIPKKYSSLYTEVSEELNVPEALVDAIVDFYYKELRLNLTELKHPRIDVEGLGQLVVRPNLAEKVIDKLNNVLVAHDTSTFKAYHNKKAMEEKLELLKDVNVKIKKEKDRKETFYKNKNNESSIKSNLGE